MTTTISAPHAESQRIDFARDLNDVPGTLSAAIALADYKNVGAPFAPFVLKAMTGADVYPIWISERGDTPIVFYQFNGLRQDGFLPLGDVAIAAVNGFEAPFSAVGALLFAAQPGSDALAHPTGFDWVLDDAGSANSRNLSYYWPIAPDGYSAVGLCFSNGLPPDPKNYWCVKTSYLRMGVFAPYWSDSGQHWKHHDGTLVQPRIDTSSGPTQGNQVLIAPTTFYSVEALRDPYVLVAQKCFLPVSPLGTQPPVYDPNAGTGSTTPVGLQNVAVVPFTAVSDPSFLTKPEDSPFYYLANEPHWYCYGSRPTPDGGQYMTSITVGVSTTSSQSFSKSTSFSVGVNVGIAAGDKGGFNGGISTTYTSEMSVTTEQTQQNDSSTTDQITVELPKQPVTQFWQRSQQLVMYRTDMTTVSASDYRTNDVRFVPDGTVVSIH